MRVVYAECMNHHLHILIPPTSCVGLILGSTGVATASQDTVEGTMRILCSPGGYSTLVWVGVCRWDFWNATHPCTHFEGKVTHPCTKNQNFSLKFAPFWRKFRKILKSWPIKVPNLRHFGANFRKFWKIDPSKYHVFEKKGTHWCTWRPDFATHVCGTSL